jgi:hypothetical protein
MCQRGAAGNDKAAPHIIPTDTLECVGRAEVPFSQNAIATFRYKKEITDANH